MDFEDACKWLNAIEVLESQETLANFKSNDWPHLKRNDREKMHRQLHKMAYPSEWSNTKALSLEEAAKRLSGFSIPGGKVK